MGVLLVSTVKCCPLSNWAAFKVQLIRTFQRTEKDYKQTAVLAMCTREKTGFYRSKVPQPQSCYLLSMFC